MQPDLLVESRAPEIDMSSEDSEGEWPGMMYANWLLDQRFGIRKRPYISHIAKIFSTPILLEMAAIWGEELSQVDCLFVKCVSKSDVSFLIGRRLQPDFEAWIKEPR